MNQQPDDLFRQKLEGFQKPAPATAWGKIADAQNKKGNKGLWLKIAASLLLFGLVIYTRWPDAPVNENVSGIVSDVPALQPDVASLQTKQNEEAKDIEVEKESIATSKKSAFRHNDPRQMRTVTVSETNTNVTESIALSAEEIDVALRSEYADSSLLQPSYVQASENITMIFTAKEVNEYLEKKEIPKATDDAKKPSTWMKVLKKANDLTNNQDPFGELRQKKNEILALNFRNDKQRGQNKQ